MSEPVVRLEPTRISVEPGGQAVVTVTAINLGTVVEGYDVDVVSATPMPWATPSPPTLSVYPQQEASATITFAPPRGPQTPGGSFPFGVRLRSQVDRSHSAVAEGDLDITAVSGLQAELAPVTSSGRWRGRHTLKLDNYGNGPARLQVAATDPDQALGFLVSPPLLDVPLGGQGYARIKVRTRHPVLRGEIRRVPFKVVCEPEPAAGQTHAGFGPMSAVSTPERPVLDGAFNQKPILDRWVVLAAGLTLAAIVALIAWFLTHRGDEAADGEEERPVAPDQPTNVVAKAVEPGIMALTWDKVDTATAYKVTLTKPSNDDFSTAGQAVADQPNRIEFRMDTDRKAEFCYVVVAVRDGAPASLPSSEACSPSIPTLAQQTAPSPTAPATVDPAPGFEEQPPSDGTTTPPPASSTSPGGNAAFLTVLKGYDASNESGAATDLDTAQRAGLTTVKMGDPETLKVELEGDFGFLLYVEGVSATAAQQECERVLATAPIPGSFGCREEFTFPLPDGPTSTPSSTAAAVPTP